MPKPFPDPEILKISSSTPVMSQEMQAIYNELGTEMEQLSFIDFIVGDREVVIVPIRAYSETVSDDIEYNYSIRCKDDMEFFLGVFPTEFEAKEYSFINGFTITNIVRVL